MIAVVDHRAQILRGRLRRAARVAGGLAIETPDVLTPEQLVALDRALADVERCLDRAALAVGVRVLP